MQLLIVSIQRNINICRSSHTCTYSLDTSETLSRSCVLIYLILSSDIRIGFLKFLYLGISYIESDEKRTSNMSRCLPCKTLKTSSVTGKSIFLQFLVTHVSNEILRVFILGKYDYFTDLPPFLFRNTCFSNCFQLLDDRPLVLLTCQRDVTNLEIWTDDVGRSWSVCSLIELILVNYSNIQRHFSCF